MGDEAVFDDAYVERYALVANSEQSNFTILRSWASLDNDPLLAVDFDGSYGDLTGTIDTDTFPHAQLDGGTAFTETLREQLADEHVVIIWANTSDDGHIPFIGRSAQVGREEQLIAGYLNDNPFKLEVSFRQELSALEPKGRGLRL